MKGSRTQPQGSWQAGTGAALRQQQSKKGTLYQPLLPLLPPHVSLHHSSPPHIKAPECIAPPHSPPLPPSPFHPDPCCPQPQPQPHTAELSAESDCTACLLVGPREGEEDMGAPLLPPIRRLLPPLKLPLPAPEECVKPPLEGE